MLNTHTYSVHPLRVTDTHKYVSTRHVHWQLICIAFHPACTLITHTYCPCGALHWYSPVLSTRHIHWYSRMYSPPGAYTDTHACIAHLSACTLILTRIAHLVLYTDTHMVLPTQCVHWYSHILSTQHIHWYSHVLPTRRIHWYSHVLPTRRVHWYSHVLSIRRVQVWTHVYLVTLGTPQVFEFDVHWGSRGKYSVVNGDD